MGYVGHQWLRGILRVSPFLRRVKTASVATAVQIVAKGGRTNRIIEELGSAPDEAELATWSVLGFDEIHDEAFFQLALARLVEPTLMLNRARVLGELGIEPMQRCSPACGPSPRPWPSSSVLRPR